MRPQRSLYKQMQKYTISLEKININDINIVGGKNASTGEMLQNLSKLDIKVPSGFATTTMAFDEFVAQNNLIVQINNKLNSLDVENVVALQKTGKQIRDWIMATKFPANVEQAIDKHYQELEQQFGNKTTWAVRSSATTEDMPDASFAGQQETYLNVSGIDNIKLAIRKVFASLFNDRAIAYRTNQGYQHENFSLSVGIQKMIRSDIACSGVMFSLDTESGFRDVVFITASYGLGEILVQGGVNPDEFYVHKDMLNAGNPAILQRNLGSKEKKMLFAKNAGKFVKIVPVVQKDRNIFCLNDKEIEQLAKIAINIEQHYKSPMDIEWAKDGIDGEIYIVQARPETVQSNKKNIIERYRLKGSGKILAKGRAVGNRIGAGRVNLLNGISDIGKFNSGDIILTDMTDPDWEPIMKRASAIITNRGGRTCHAAIIARELGIPAVVGCGNATKTIAHNSDATVSCAKGNDGFVYQGILEFEYSQQSLENMPKIPVKIMMNIGNPSRAFDFATLPNDGVGLARLEFIINNMIGIHPKAILHADTMPDDIKRQIKQKTLAYDTAIDFYIKRLQEGVSSLAAAFYPKPVIVRMSDFKSNEYANLLGGKQFEPIEENPMIGFRGAARYTSDDFRECFDMECKAMHYVRNNMGFTNVELMIPFVRTIDEAKDVIEILKQNNLQRGKNGLRLIMMCEIPSNAVMASEFLQYFDGFSIGSNDMTQLTLGIDRDSELLAESFDEQDPAVLSILEMAIKACHKENKYIGICGQGPSDNKDFAKWLLKLGISSISLNPDTVVDTWLSLAND